MTPETILLRQVHPNFCPDGQLSSQAFHPFPKDEGLLSFYDGDQVSAAESFSHYTRVLQFVSHGVWGVACGEAESVGLGSRPDPLQDFDFHAVIDFTSINASDWRKLAKKLKTLAMTRGCLHQALE